MLPPEVQHRVESIFREIGPAQKRIMKWETISDYLFPYTKFLTGRVHANDLDTLIAIWLQPQDERWNKCEKQCWNNPSTIFKKMGQPRTLFRLFSAFSNKHHYVKNVMTIQYTALGIERTTFGTWASSHNH